MAGWRVCCHQQDRVHRCQGRLSWHRAFYLLLTVTDTVCNTCHLSNYHASHYFPGSNLLSISSSASSDCNSQGDAWLVEHTYPCQVLVGILLRSITHLLILESCAYLIQVQEFCLVRCPSSYVQPLIGLCSSVPAAQSATVELIP